MFREMRRKKQKLAEEECRAIIERANSGVMGVIGDEGYPYTVPVNPFLMGNKLYFHSAKAGHKIDAIAKEPKVSFTFIDKVTWCPESLPHIFAAFRSSAKRIS